MSVLPIRAMGRCGGRGNAADLATAINWAAGLAVPGVPQNERKADVINLSISLRKTCEPDEVGVLKQALEDARKAGVVVVAAAGNKKTDAQPVDIKEVHFRRAALALFPLPPVIVADVSRTIRTTAKSP